jgi:hypothetical protein
MLHVNVAHDGREGTAHCYAILLLIEFVVHLKVGGPQANIQKFHDSFHFQNGAFRQCVVIFEPTSDDLEGFINRYTGEETNHIKAGEGILFLEINRLQYLYEVAGDFDE